MAATTATAAEGYDPEFVPFIPAIEARFKQFRTLPRDEFIKIWNTTPVALPENAPSLEEIDVLHENVPVSDGEEIEIQIYRPKGVEDTLPVFFVMHGGGWWMGTHSMEEAQNRFVCV